MGLFSKPNASDADLSAAEQAMLKRNKSLVDEEIMESEKRLKAMSRRRLGNASLLVGLKGGGDRPAGGPSRPARPSLVSGGGSAGGGAGNNYTGTGNAMSAK